MRRFYALVAALLMSAAPVAVAQAPYVELPATTTGGVDAITSRIVVGPRVFVRVDGLWTLETTLHYPSGLSPSGEIVSTSGSRIAISDELDLVMFDRDAPGEWRWSTFLFNGYH